MTAQLSRERLEEIVSDPTINQGSEFAEMARMLLAGMDSEPVVTDAMALAFHQAITDSSAGSDDIDEIKTGLRAAVANYTAPPAQVAVPDEWRSVLQEMVNAMLAYEMDVGEPAPYKHRKMMMRAEHLLESHRAAMQADVTLINEGDNHSEDKLAMVDHSGDSNNMVEPVKAATDNTSRQFESVAVGTKSEGLQRCAASRDGECHHTQCPQLRDNEPATSGRHCPIDNWEDD
ncbi:hypothetical protein MML63_12295 [Kosakonia sacchari]|uniref:hypothetical protein n=1 Tax=Kosakonia sacchari TaxID=1158459 RepID=UPI0025B0C7FE|nr:hypothetical protein [Kosakonia sacchari]MDN2486404.1 hypothetical protein [Kosakonia sacchari]